MFLGFTDVNIINEFLCAKVFGEDGGCLSHVQNVADAFEIT